MLILSSHQSKWNEREQVAFKASFLELKKLSSEVNYLIALLLHLERRNKTIFTGEFYTNAITAMKPFVIAVTCTNNTYLHT